MTNATDQVTSHRSDADSSSVKSPGDFGLAIVGFVLLTVWRLPPLVVVIVSAFGGAALSIIGS